MAKQQKTEPADNNEEVITLPHQEVLEDLYDRGIITKDDLNKDLNREIGSIEGVFAKAVEQDDEKKQQTTIERSKKLANVLLEFGRKIEESAQSEKDFNQFVEQADALMAEQKYAEARELYNQALAINGTDSHVQGQLAIIEEELGKLAQAEADQQKFNAHIEAALGLVEAGKLPEARLEYEAALAIKPEDPTVLERINEIDEHLNKSQHQLDPNDPEYISKSKARRLDIMNDIEKQCKANGKITHQELLDIGVKKYDSALGEFTIGKKDRDGKEITLVKVSDGVYSLKKQEKKTNWGLIGGIALGIAALVGIGLAIAGKSKKQ